MSVEEEVELRDLVAQTLELNGCLPKIRAQLRSNLFLALDEDPKLSQQTPLSSTKMKQVSETPEGRLMFCLVREFLEYFDLDFTTSVYEPESQIGNFYKYEGRQKIVEDLGLKPDENASGPVLLEVVKIAQTKSKTLKINLNINEDCSSVVSQMNGYREIEHQKNNHNVKKSEILDSTYVKKDVENDDTFNGTSSIEEESVNGDVSHKSNDSEHDSSLEKKSKIDKKTKLELPPLQLNKSRDLLPSLYKKSNKEYDFEIKDDYEEDFMSGSEIEFSQKIDSPKPLFEELLQCSEHTSKNVNSRSSSDNKSENIATNLEDTDTSAHCT